MTTAVNISHLTNALHKVICHMDVLSECTPCYRTEILHF